MPSVSRSQQSFMGMVHAVQTGQMPLSKASPRVLHVAKTMTPRDTSHFAATKRKGLPEKVEDKSAAFQLSVATVLTKIANVEGVLGKMRSSVHQLGISRRKHYETENKAMRKQIADMQKQLQDSNQQMQSMTAASQAQPVTAPSPPPAQPAYGSMLAPREEDEKNKKQ